MPTPLSTLYSVESAVQTRRRIFKFCIDRKNFIFVHIFHCMSWIGAFDFTQTRSKVADADWPDAEWPDVSEDDHICQWHHRSRTYRFNNENWKTLKLLPTFFSPSLDQ